MRLPATPTSPPGIDKKTHPDLGTVQPEYAARAIIDDYMRLRQEAELLAGDTSALAGRAAAHRMLYRHSGGNFVFPLIAAHGALWGAAYFNKGLRLGRALACLARPTRRAPLNAGLDLFVERFRAINRRVFVETFTHYQFTRRHGDAPPPGDPLPAVLLSGLLAVHAARRTGHALDAQQKAALYEAFFRWEQDAIVGPGIEEAVAEFEWHWFRRLALSPVISFRYIPRRQRFRFADMSDKEERIRHGLTALRIAEQVGFAAVDDALDRYGAWRESTIPSSRP